ncbi:MAG: hypothetical protein ABSG98_03310 [Anaerolineales bacterium]
MNKRKGLTSKKLITLLEANLQPVKPRKEFVDALQDRLTNSAGMRILAERRWRWLGSAALAGVGLVGILAWAAAVAAMGLRIVGRILALSQNGSAVTPRS